MARMESTAACTLAVALYGWSAATAAANSSASTCNAAPAAKVARATAACTKMVSNALAAASASTSDTLKGATWERYAGNRPCISTHRSISAWMDVSGRSVMAAPALDNEKASCPATSATASATSSTAASTSSSSTMLL